MTLNTIINTLFVGNVWYHCKSVHSTNDLAAEWLSEPHQYVQKTVQNHSFNHKHPITEGVVITTFNQTAGRGQMGNQWLAEPDQNIAFSVILKPSFLEVRDQFHLNKAIALAVHDFFNKIFNQYKPSVAYACQIKWPNDIYFYDQKIAGILIQNTISGRQLQDTIIGIGLNINQLDFPPEFNATSLKRALETDFDLFELVQQLAQAIEHRYLQLKTSPFKKIHDEYLSKLYRFGIESAFQYTNGQAFRGTILGVSATGRLEVLTTEGVRGFEIKEIKFIPYF